MADTETLVNQLGECAGKQDFAGAFALVRENLGEIARKLHPAGVQDALKKTTSDRLLLSFLDGVQFGEIPLEESLVRLAEKMAAKVIKYKRSMALEPMNSYERHIIHAALQDYEGVTTSSTGTEPNRRVVVSYDRPQNNGNKPQSREWA